MPVMTAAVFALTTLTAMAFATSSKWQVARTKLHATTMLTQRIQTNHVRIRMLVTTVMATASTMKTATVLATSLKLQVALLPPMPTLMAMK